MPLISSFVAFVKACWLKQQANRSRLKLLDKPKRSLNRFKALYPQYKMGANCYGVPNVKHAHTDALLIIGNYCSFAKNVQIFLGGNHRVDWVSTYRFPVFFESSQHIQHSAITKGHVVIGSDVWLCENTTILSGVEIGHGAVVANSAIVTKDVPAYAIVGGNPAKFIRWRFEEAIREALLKSAWWNWPEAEILSVAHLICSDDVHAFLSYANKRKQPL